MENPPEIPHIPEDVASPEIVKLANNMIDQLRVELAIQKAALEEGEKAVARAQAAKDHQEKRRWVNQGKAAIETFERSKERGKRIIAAFRALGDEPEIPEALRSETVTRLTLIEGGRRSDASA